MLKNQDNTLTHRYNAPKLKPNKNRLQTESYRPVILLSVWRKLLSMIIPRRLDDVLEQSISRSQHAYSKNKSSRDVISTKTSFCFQHRKIQPQVSICLKLSILLIEFLSNVIRPANLGVIEILLANNTFAVKFKKNV